MPLRLSAPQSDERDRQQLPAAVMRYTAENGAAAAVHVLRGHDDLATVALQSVYGPEPAPGLTCINRKRMKLGHCCIAIKPAVTSRQTIQHMLISTEEGGLTPQDVRRPPAAPRTLAAIHATAGLC